MKWSHVLAYNYPKARHVIDSLKLQNSCIQLIVMLGKVSTFFDSPYEATSI